MILLVTSNDLLALNQTRRMQSELITMMYPKEMICVALNFFQKGHPVDANMVGKQLGKPVLGIVPKFREEFEFFIKEGYSKVKGKAHA